ncbi:serine hydrolase [Rugamonas sp. CCM 8940]|nr:serine hydrolase [Rugamonas sp. CCM 8940]
MVIAKLGGMPYDKYISEQFLRPLGMKHTYFDVEHGVIAGQASPYEEGPIPAHYISPSLGYAAGSFFSSNADIALWSEALAALQKKALAPAGAAPLIGRYDDHGKARTISYADGQLFSEVPGFPPSKIHPVSSNVFFFDDNDDARLEFAFKDGKVVGLQRYDVDREPWLTYTRAE